jgi:hypothetical protein
MDDVEYIRDRLEPQIAWYDNKSASHKRWYVSLRVAEILSAALIVFFTGGIVVHPDWALYVVAGLGVVVAVAAGVTSLFHLQENWIQYRSTCETLRHEKYLYLTKVDPYNTADPFSLLVGRIESLISKEHTAWAQYIKKPREEDHG